LETASFGERGVESAEQSPPSENQQIYHITAIYWLCAPVGQLVHVVWCFPALQLVSLLEIRIPQGVKSPELVTSVATTAVVSLPLLFLQCFLGAHHTDVSRNSTIAPIRRGSLP
jgi:hypothetical protein